MDLRPGLVVVSKRSRTGRRWRLSHQHQGFWVLRPLGADVCDARSPTTGKWQGGVRTIIRHSSELVERFKEA